MAESKAQTRRVLSVQSHVVHGYVGNKSATFPLQVLGFDVDALNSVQFSNHTGYPSVKGQILTESELAQLFKGLEDNNLISKYSHLLTGYIGNATFLREVAIIAKKLRLANPKLVYVCDPVMGDGNKMYVPEELLPIYRDEIVPLADIITPNQFEVELITQMKIQTESDIWKAVDWFHERGIKTVAISSSDLGQKGTLRAFLSQRFGKRYAITIPKQGDGAHFTGTGDLFASLFLAHSYELSDYGEAFEKTIATLQAVIKRTIENIPSEVTNLKRSALKVSEYELRLIQSKSDIEQPTVTLKTETIQSV